jgi:cytochrome b561
MTTIDTQMLAIPAQPRHTALTRLIHGALAILVIVQLTSSQFMVVEEPGKAANGGFVVHQYAGLAAFLLVLGFWAAASLRRRGTELGRLFPWFSRARIAAVTKDTWDHLASILKLRVPPYAPEAPLAAAIHGLGLIIITLMAASGGLYYFVNAGDPDGGGLVALAMTVHCTAANLAWAYLIAHASIAVIYHFASDMSLRDMWNVAAKPRKEN